MTDERSPEYQAGYVAALRDVVALIRDQLDHPGPAERTKEGKDALWSLRERLVAAQHRAAGARAG